MNQSFEYRTSFGYVVNLTARLLARQVDATLADLGLSSGSLPVFLILMENGPLSQKDLARLALIEQPTMAATLTRMERDQLVIRTPHPVDRRVCLFSLSDRIRDKSPAVVAALMAINDHALAGLTAAERAALIDRLSSIADSVADSVQKTKLQRRRPSPPD